MNTIEKPTPNYLYKESKEEVLSVKSGRILWDFVFKNHLHKWYIRIGISFIIIQFVIFKYIYPYAGFINGDSYSYLETAYHNLSINTYPVGYSMLLRMISVFTKSDTMLVAIQYLLLQLSVQGFIFTLFYFYRPTRLTKILLFSLTLFNPVFLYLANYVSSDSFFVSISMIWFTQLFWIINRPNNKLIFVNSIILFIAFTVRYNALFYPLIALVSVFQGKVKTWNKLAGLGLSALLIVIFIAFTSIKYYNLTGHKQFTPFSGWQTANNALYAYRYVDSNNLKKVPRRFQELDKMVRTYFDTTRDIKKYPKEGLVASTVYMWDPSSPLCIYTENQFKKDTAATQLKKWATVAPLMGDYGTFLIKEYPKEYINYYLIPNIIKYYAPPVEFLEWYSTGVDSVSIVAQAWFNYKTTKLRTHSKDYKVRSLSFFPVLTGTMNIVLLFSLISFITLKGYKKYPRLKNGMLLVVALWLVNFGFSVLASPIALRFQLFPILVSLSFTFFLVEYLIKSASGIETSINSTDTSNNPLEPAT